MGEEEPQSDGHRVNLGIQRANKLRGVGIHGDSQAGEGIRGDGSSDSSKRSKSNLNLRGKSIWEIIREYESGERRDEYEREHQQLVGESGQVGDSVVPED